MSDTVRPLIAGNWKMNGLTAALDQAKALAKALADAPAGADVALCPPATLLAQMAWTLKDSCIAVGGQDCHGDSSGPFTGDISAEMLRDAGASLVILGHSERRTYHHETSFDVAAKVEGAVRAGLKPIVCVGETLAQKEVGRTLMVIEGQLTQSLPADVVEYADFAVAYEPYWAIGVGITPTLAQIEDIHGSIRTVLSGHLGDAAAARIPILYGGSVKPSNAGEILRAKGVGGALVGGASLKAADFLGIIRAV
jgi:triosephosphate isomerase